MNDITILTFYIYIYIYILNKLRDENQLKKYYYYFFLLA